jgi:TolB-like protein
MIDHPATPGGVFLSYAREDTEAARRIADALRGFGVEVWFDQSELRGGDAWDAKIKKQIRECALFVPIVSLNTQTRGEGYFRREWKLAVERTHDMAAGVPFLLPVVIDETAESEALVPDELMRVQWTRLSHGAPTPHFVEQVKQLLEGLSNPIRKAGRLGPALHREAAAPAVKSTIPGWRWGVLAAVLVGVGICIVALRKPEPPVAVAKSAPDSKPAVPASAPPAEGKSIAVLPFANFSPDKENEFFASGLHDEVITVLAKIHALKVISRTSVMAYKNPEGRNLKKIAAELGVVTVLEGSLQRVGNKVHFNMQLIDARTDDHLWADTFDGDMADIFALQARLAQEIAAALKATLTPGERTLIARRPTENQEAYELYLRARALDQRMGFGSSKEEFERVIDLYEQAAMKDPAFALPHVQASVLHGTMYWFGSLDPTPERRTKAQAEVNIAQRLAPGAPETILAQGSFDYTCRNDWAGALVNYRAAEAGLPNDAQLHLRIALALRRLSQWPEALTRLEQAAALNPNDLNGINTLISTVFSLRRYPQALELISRYQAIFPDDFGLKSNRTKARYELDGDRGAFLRALVALPPTASDVKGLERAYGIAMKQGDLAAADHALADLRITSVENIDATIRDPVALHRAFIAWLRGRPEEARRFADEAIAVYRRQKWALRQEGWSQFGIARAEAYAGRIDEAIRDGKAALDEELARDAISALGMRVEYGQVLVIGNRREEALALLREIIAMPSYGLGPNEIRFDPVWSRLKDDPRFEAILKSAKPL